MATVYILNKITTEMIPKEWVHSIFLMEQQEPWTSQLGIGFKYWSNIYFTNDLNKDLKKAVYKKFH